MAIISLFNTDQNFRFWLAEELSDDHRLNVNKDTKTDIKINKFLSYI